MSSSPKLHRIVYTCLFGRYEVLNEQTCPNRSGIGFICFTDLEKIKSTSWKLRRVPPQDIGSDRDSRLPKLLPHHYLANYEQSLYIDNRVLLTSDPADLFDRFLPADGPGFAVLPHHKRASAFEEAEHVIAEMVDDEVRVREQIDAYRANGFPDQSGLFAGTVILRRHNQPDIVQFDTMWCNHVLRYSKRDQISFPYCAWKLGLAFTTIDERVSENPFFKWPVADRRLPPNFKDEEYLWLNPDVARNGYDARTHVFKFGHKEKRKYRYHPPLPLDRLANKYRSDKGSAYYNRHFYSRVYEHYLAPLRTAGMTLVEIGLLRHDVQQATEGNAFRDAPSLFMWDEYFEQAEILGIDIADFSAAVRGKIRFARADQSNRTELLAAVASSQKPLRVIIDDGSHASHHQQITLACLFPKLVRGGLYFIEDLHHQPRNLEAADALKTRNLLRALVNGIPVESPYLSPDEIAYLRQEIADVRFFDSMDYAVGPRGADALAVITKR